MFCVGAKHLGANYVGANYVGANYVLIWVKKKSNYKSNRRKVSINYLTKLETLYSFICFLAYNFFLINPQHYLNIIKNRLPQRGLHENYYLIVYNV